MNVPVAWKLEITLEGKIVGALTLTATTEKDISGISNVATVIESIVAVKGVINGTNVAGKGTIEVLV